MNEPEPTAMLLKLLTLLAEVGGLSVIVFAAVAYLKQWGVSGNWLTGSSFACGLVLGVAWRYAASPLVTFADWFWAALFGLMCGFLASGAYKGAQGIAGTDEKGTAATLKADNKQTAKIITAIDAGPETKTTQ
jgi:hypothetical protein